MNRVVAVAEAESGNESRREAELGLRSCGGGCGGCSFENREEKECVMVVEDLLQ